jgi:hypothetical protein
VRKKSTKTEKGEEKSEPGILKLWTKSKSFGEKNGPVCSCFTIPSTKVLRPTPVGPQTNTLYPANVFGLFVFFFHCRQQRKEEKNNKQKCEPALFTLRPSSIACDAL